MGRKDKIVAPQDSATLPMGMRLRYLRQNKKISLTEMAQKLTYSKGYLSGIENGNIRVSRELVQRYEKALDLKEGELNNLLSDHSQPQSTLKQQLWSMPYQRNLFFTGREQVLEKIRTRLLHSSTLPRALAITGLGGIGKTQLAVEYAYCYRHMYQAVLWLNADSHEILLTSCIELANHLNLPERGAKDRQATFTIIQQWLQENRECLIVLDNVDNPIEVLSFLSHLGENHILITTRTQAVGAMAQTLELREMAAEESMLLLLKRAKIIPLDADLTSVSEATQLLARNIVEIMAGLPLALNQAGSYIEETGSGLSGYFNLLKNHQPKILQEIQQNALDYPTSVATTWTLSFEKIGHTYPLAADLLYLCAFLHSDNIYEELITTGATHPNSGLQAVANNPFELHRAVAELRKYSLVRTDPESGAISIHRLVQVVIRAALDQQAQHLWAQRTLCLVNQAFPLVKVADWHTTWSTCQKYYPQAEAAQALITPCQLLSTETIDLLNKMGKYREERTEFKEAEQLLLKALQVSKSLYDEEHLVVATTLLNLAHMYTKQAKYTQAEACYRQVIFIQNKLIGLEQIDIHILKSYVALLLKLERKKEVAEWNQHMSQRQLSQASETITRTTINDDNAAIEYSSKDHWFQQNHPGDFNSDAHLTKTPGAAFGYTFKGIGIEIISNTETAHGEIDISIDDVYRCTVNTLRINNQLTQTIIFSETTLEPGLHTLKVVLLRGEFLLDALAIFAYN